MTTQRSGLATFLEKNLWAVVASMAALWSGYLAGQMTMQSQIDRMDDRLKRAEGQLSGLRGLTSCTVRTLDRVTSSVKVPLPCELKTTE